MGNRNFLIGCRHVLVTVLALFTGNLLFAADDNLGESVLNDATDSLRRLVDSLVTFLQVVMGMGALVVLAMVIFKVFKGDREAAEKLAWWFAGLTLGFVLLAVVSKLVKGM